MISKKIVLALCVFQIILLINFSFAQSYNLSLEEIQRETKIGELSKDIIKSGLNLVIGFLSIKQIGFVSAEYCCEETLEGGLCQEVDSANECSILKSYSPASCSTTSFCKNGYCVDTDGLCSLAPRSLCESDGGQWSNNEPNECSKGCCYLGANTQYREEAWCANQGGEFNSEVSETECSYLSSDLEGACTYQVGDEITCEFIDEKSCNNIEHLDFEKGVLCSNEDLGTNCEKMNSINCLNGKIYWFDSCGNKENVYTTNEDETDWNFGYLRPKANIPCTVTNSNRESCGNCDSVYSICKAVSGTDTHVDEDNFVCGDLGCDENNDGINDRRNGESWCVYEGFVGEFGSGGINISADVPGTTHYKKECNQGEITTTSCGEYRDTICGERVTEVDGSDFSEATCRLNNGRSCFQSETLDECQDEPDCRVQVVDVRGEKGETETINEIPYLAARTAINPNLGESFIGVTGTKEKEDPNTDYFYFSTCVPKYPEGFDPEEYEEETWSDAEAVCGMATMTCAALQQYKLDSHCSVRKAVLFGRGECLLTIFTKVYLDYIANEECTKNKQLFYEEMNDLCVSLGDCAGYVNSVGNYTGNIRLKERYVGLNNTPLENDVPKYIGLVSDRPSSRSIIIQLIETTMGNMPESAEETMSSEEKDLMNYRALNGAAGSIGLMVGGYGYIVAAVAAIIEAVLFNFIGAGKVGQIEKEDVNFYCEPWEPPSKSNDCEKCNEGDLPCTEYKCWSLGKNCKVLDNEGGVDSDETICVEIDQDASAPVIEFENISGGLRSSVNLNDANLESGVSITTSNDECLDGNTLVNFTLVTDSQEENKYSRCRYGYDIANYNEYKDIWTNKPNSGSTWTKNHEFTFRIPYYESSYVDETGEFNVYVRCENHEGFANVNEYIVNFCVKETPDITAPFIEEFEPNNGWYLEYGKTSLDSLTVTTNEPVLSCKYSFDDNTDYDNMVSSVYCDDKEPRVDYTCSFGEIDDLTNPINNLYFKCKDIHNNTMATSTLYSVYPSKGELDIVSTSPTGYNQKSSADNTYPLTLKVTTANGGDDSGLATCYYTYSWTDSDPFADGKEHEFFETGTNIHTQELHFREGDYNIPVRCEDKYGNSDSSNIEFKLDIDNTAPEIATIYKSGNYLYITTHKDAKCYYDILDTAQCNVDMTNVSLLMNPKTENSIIHYTDWDAESTYHIQCIDNLNNIGGCVSIVPSLF